MDLQQATPKVGKRSSYVGAAIYRNESRDGGASFGPDLKLADPSCECCRIALASCPGLAPVTDGGFHAVWFGMRRQGSDHTAAVRYARLAPDGSPRLETVRPLPDELAEHGDVLAWGDRVAVPCCWRLRHPTL